MDLIFFKLNTNISYEILYFWFKIDDLNIQQTKFNEN